MIKIHTPRMGLVTANTRINGRGKLLTFCITCPSREMCVDVGKEDVCAVQPEHLYMLQTQDPRDVSVTFDFHMYGPIRRQLYRVEQKRVST